MNSITILWKEEYLIVDDEPKGAVFVEERTHRLYLWRRWTRDGSWVMFIGLNPSTADERLDDPTIRRCVGFARRWGFGGIFMCNVYTLVSTDPGKLNDEVPVTIGASLAMRVIRNRCKQALVGWGNQITRVRGWEERVDRIKRELAPLHCLGMTKKGHPKHPLYLPYTVQPVLFEHR